MGIITLGNKILMSGNQMVLYVPPPEIWLINESFDHYEFFDFDVKFTSNSERFKRFTCYGIGELEYEYFDGTRINVYIEGWSSSNQVYRTIILDEPASGDFLTWLQANAVKQ